MSVSLIAQDTTQMGVSMLLTGQDYWFSYLEGLVEAAEIDQSTADEWEKEYDGYEMVWTFTEPAVAVADGNIDAVCIMGGATVGANDASSYSDGGFCCGIKYSGDFSAQPEIYAVWFSKALYDDWTAALGFSAGVEDTANWRTDDTSYTVSWDVNRWLPKEQRSVEFYTNEYRFQTNDIIKTFTYTYTTDALYAKEVVQSDNFTLTGALETLASTAFTLASAFVIMF